MLLWMIVLIEEVRQTIKFRLELWRQTLETKRFSLSSNKTKYIPCVFYSRQEKYDLEVTMGKNALQKF